MVTKQDCTTQLASPKMCAQQVDAEEISKNDTTTKNGHTVMNLKFAYGVAIVSYLSV